MRTIATGLLSLAFAAPSSATAHHSRVTFFDMSRTVELAGEITRVQWRHPHVRYWIQADPEFGGALWELETTPPSLLERQGITRDILAAGTHVRVAGPPSKVAEHAMEVSHVLLPDGREVLLHTGRAPRWTDNTVERALQGFAEDSVRAAEASADGIFRVWTRPGLAGDDRPPFWLDRYPLTADGRAAVAAWNAVTDIETGCTPKAMPALMGSFWPIELIDAGDRLELRVEEFDSVRVIHMESAPAPATSSPLGYSTGRWENGDLLVTTTGVDADQLDGRGIPMSRNAEFLERFSLNAEETRLDYAITITDPTTFTDPITLTSHWVWRPGETIKAYDCIETPDSWTSKEIELLE
jgi:hypothetical protein